MTDNTSTPRKSCVGCDFFIGARNADAQSASYGGPVPFASCAKTGQFLSPSSSRVTDSGEQDKHFETVAESCPSYAETGRVRTVRRKTAGLSFGLQMMSDASIGEVATNNLPTWTSPVIEQDDKSCSQCIFFSPESGVKLGVSAPVCLARAEVMPHTLTSSQRTAANCQSFTDRQGRSLSINDTEKMVGNITVTPSLNNFMEIDLTYGYVIREIVESNKPFEFVEPTTYETDIEVTEEDKAEGIRAWRRIYDAKQKRSVCIPIFDPSIFSEDEREKIPQSGSREHPELYQDHPNNAYKVATLWFKMDETPMLQGVAGTGKTEFYRYMAWLMQLPFERVSITRSSELDDLAGKMLFESNETVFQKGRIPKAWGKPGVLCLDEPNVGPLEVWQFVRPLTDNSKQLVLDMNNGETVIRHKYCRMGMAINPSWDSRNIGAEPLADADSNRLAHIFVDFPSEAIERNIIKNRCKMDGYDLPDATLDKVMSVALSLRDMSQSEDLPITWGIRQQLKVARATEYFDLEDCYKMAATDNLEPEVAEVVLNTVRLKADDKYGQGGMIYGSRNKPF